MIYHDVEQGSVDWYALRLGIPTASEFHKIITPIKGELSKTAGKYMDYLIAEKLLNRPLESLDGLEWMERGQELEPMAVRMYEFEKEIETKKVGFITSNDGEMGASPDRVFVDLSAGVELKCPSPQVHVGYMRNTFEEKYIPQVQGQIMIGDFEFVDRYSYHPELPPVTTRTYRDAKYIEKMSAALDKFNTTRLEALHEIEKQGYFIAKGKIVTVPEAALGEYIVADCDGYTQANYPNAG